MPSKDDKSAQDLRAEMLDDSAPPLPPDYDAGETSAVSEELKAAEDAKLREEGIDPNHPVLSVEEQRQAIERAKARVLADEKKEAAKALEQAVYDEQRGRTGLRTGDPIKDELVFVTLDLAEHSDSISINGHRFWHGHTYRVPRHVAQTLAEIQQRGHHHQADLDGKGIAERGKKPRLTAVKADQAGNIVSIENAPQAAA